MSRLLSLQSKTTQETIKDQQQKENKLEKNPKKTDFFFSD